MPIITPSDLSTHIYPEIVSEITRTDNTIVTNAINTAVHEAKMYLSRYDLVALFGTDTTAPTVTDQYLQSIVKDITCWHIIRLSNVNVDSSLYRNNYYDALEALKNIMKGNANPDGWPYKDTTAESVPDGDSISWTSNDQRENAY
ncbi:MAG: DUF1320 family protein [Taibaiella sp.]|nr:DUF1320 family protein [Taibaiella sp.]